MKRKEERRQYNQYLEQVREDRRIREELIEEDNEKRRRAADKIRKKEEERRAKERALERLEKEREAERREEEARVARIREEEMVRDLLGILKNEKVIDLVDIAERLDQMPESIKQRITTFLQKGTVIGAFDQQGHFIQLTTEEAHAMVAHIHERGRVTKAELASWCNEHVSMPGVGGDGVADNAEEPA
ncbi:hypothetical protein HDV00_009363 [Rhizophlyctis rosea]|nr:hypothetical protein HDV00_009363 [Rhizophlyctis rosea]